MKSFPKIVNWKGSKKRVQVENLVKLSNREQIDFHSASLFGNCVMKSFCNFNRFPTIVMRSLVSNADVTWRNFRHFENQMYCWLTVELEASFESPNNKSSSTLARKDFRKLLKPHWIFLFGEMKLQRVTEKLHKIPRHYSQDVHGGLRATARLFMASKVKYFRLYQVTSFNLYVCFFGSFINSAFLWKLCRKYKWMLA